MSSFISFLVFVILISGCASNQRILEPKAFMYAADKGIGDNISSIQSGLEDLDFSIRNSDPNAGTLSTEWKTLSINNSEIGVDKVRIDINVYQERGSLKVTISYLCQIEESFSLCPNGDESLNKKLNKIEESVDSAISAALGV